MKIKTGDQVKIMTGKDKGKTGKVIQIFPKQAKVVVEGINLMKRHLRKRGNQSGQKIEFPAPLNVSNVQLIGPSGSFGRVGYKILERDGKKKKVRIIKMHRKIEEIE